MKKRNEERREIGESISDILLNVVTMPIILIEIKSRIFQSSFPTHSHLNILLPCLYTREDRKIFQVVKIYASVICLRLKFDY